MPLVPNTLLQSGKYKIVRFLSSGGFACTYEGELVPLHKRVAIKEFFIKDFRNRDEHTSHVTEGTQSKLKLVERLQNKFLEESGALYSIQHQNIFRVTDVFEENGTAYYVMNYVVGESLQQKVKNEGALSESIVLKNIRQIADALKYVHSQNPLHLDIKPGNIMVNSMDNAILIVFGACKQYDEVDGENTSTLLGKTLGYAPIEQMSNNVKQLTPVTDIYSLGATLYKLLTGNTPPDATDFFNEGLEELPESVSKSTNEAVMKAMELRVKNRPQTINSFLEMLNNTMVLSTTILDVDKRENDVDKTPVSDEYSQIEESITDDCEETLIALEYDVKMSDVHAVDLELSVKWYESNLGATKESGFGKYFGWSGPSGELKVADIEHYHSATPPHCICNTEYDMALAIARKGLRMPTKKEFDELQNESKWSWFTTVDGVSGCKVTGRNGNNIFLPAAGFRTEETEKSQNMSGQYWSGDLSKYPEEASALFFNQQGPKDWNTKRYFGFSVRPIKDKKI